MHKSQFSNSIGCRDDIYSAHLQGNYKGLSGNILTRTDIALVSCGHGFVSFELTMRQICV
ncbi:Hypothetical protein PAU_04169 [Photorhabdus asymbiotica]|uniref:Uncharacterized protein n=1 Tax=Photorhabdus asymbiotica subsp. asymbiotica (strain ATCC 43949 / 3105-77) TaxID=553480 RepID=C7BQM7_PHOAA|nr:Hypothetical protein PAU_04169 [Photorhabdus asymbiotica]